MSTSFAKLGIRGAGKGKGSNGYGIVREADAEDDSLMNEKREWVGRSLEENWGGMYSAS